LCIFFTHFKSCFYCVLVSFHIHGSDKISGGPGNDVMGHSDLVTVFDGFRDYLDCGPGEDEVWINTSVDTDIAVNCEIIHEG
jgi:hypothetical protein